MCQGKGALVSEGSRVGGRPLWDGASLLRVQPASEVEIAAFRTAEAADADEEVVDGAEGLSVVYLVEAEDEDAETG